jgi:hypothetical protein
MGISQRDPVHIRVQTIDPFPMPDPEPSAMVRITFEILNRATRRTYQLPIVLVAPYVEAVERALASQAVYWVDLDYTKLPSYPPPGMADSIPMRILRAVQHQQAVDERDARANGTAPGRSSGNASAHYGELSLAGAS